MKKLLSHAISVLIICLLLGSSLGNVQGSTATVIEEGDSLAEATYDQPLVSATSISAGSFHTCAITTEGGVKCWGNNYNGQLGDGTNTNRLTPVDVFGFEDEGVDAIAVSVGAYHTCAVTSGGAVRCWGYNDVGQLGNNTIEYESNIPVDVVGLSSGVKEISAGGSHTCVVTSTGGVMCWGNNGSGQLGYDTTPDTFSNTPKLVSGLESGVVAVSAGDNHTCAITSEGGVMCWGNNGDGQLGYDTGSEDISRIPMNVIESSGEDLLAVAVSLGESHTCALTFGGGVKCWGYNYDGQLGYDTTPDDFSNTPKLVSGLASGVKAISAGGSNTCALTSAGEVKCWGYNFYGQLGDETTINRLTPVDVFGLSSGIKAVSAGGNHTCALTSGGMVKCWGYNSLGQLGDGTTDDSLTPVDVIGFVENFTIYLPMIDR